MGDLFTCFCDIEGLLYCITYYWGGGAGDFLTDFCDTGRAESTMVLLTEGHLSRALLMDGGLSLILQIQNGNKSNLWQKCLELQLQV